MSNSRERRSPKPCFKGSACRKRDCTYSHPSTPVDNDLDRLSISRDHELCFEVGLKTLSYNDLVAFKNYRHKSEESRSNLQQQAALFQLPNHTTEYIKVVDPSDIRVASFWKDKELYVVGTPTWSFAFIAPDGKMEGLYQLRDIEFTEKVNQRRYQLIKGSIAEAKGECNSVLVSCGVILLYNSLSADKMVLLTHNVAPQSWIEFKYSLQKFMESGSNDMRHILKYLSDYITEWPDDIVHNLTFCNLRNRLEGMKFNTRNPQTTRYIEDSTKAKAREEIKRRKNNRLTLLQGKGYEWVCPRGGFNFSGDKIESPQLCAARELWEETGIYCPPSILHGTKVVDVKIKAKEDGSDTGYGFRRYYIIEYEGILEPNMCAWDVSEWKSLGGEEWNVFKKESEGELDVVETSEYTRAKSDDGRDKLEEFDIKNRVTSGKSQYRLFALDLKK